MNDRALQTADDQSGSLDAAEREPAGRYAPFLAALRHDFARGIALRELWLFLGWRDIRKHYNRTILGPFWLTLSMGILVAGLGVLYSQILNMPIREYLPYIAVGFIVWTLISGALTAGCGVFINAAASIRQVPLPFSVYLFQFVWAQLLTFCHNFAIYLVILPIFGINPLPAAFFAIPGVALLLVDVVFVTMILGPLCARFRDIPMIVASVVQVAFFMTPIIWSAEVLPERAAFVMLNPFHHLIEIVRKPLLGDMPSLTSWIICLALSAILGVVAVLFFARFRARLAYWA